MGKQLLGTIVLIATFFFNPTTAWAADPATYAEKRAAIAKKFEENNDQLRSAILRWNRLRTGEILAKNISGQRTKFIRCKTLLVNVSASDCENDKKQYLEYLHGARILLEENLLLTDNSSAVVDKLDKFNIAALEAQEARLASSTITLDSDALCNAERHYRESKSLGAEDYVMAIKKSRFHSALEIDATTNHLFRFYKLFAKYCPSTAPDIRTETRFASAFALMYAKALIDPYSLGVYVCTRSLSQPRHPRRSQLSTACLPMLEGADPATASDFGAWLSSLAQALSNDPCANWMAKEGERHVTELFNSKYGGLQISKIDTHYCNISAAPRSVRETPSSRYLDSLVDSVLVLAGDEGSVE